MKIRAGPAAALHSATVAVEVGLGKVGMVLLLEASRLARNNSDWYRLIEICGISGTLIADESAVYNPRDPNDRLLLGVNRPETQSTSYSTFNWPPAPGEWGSLELERKPSLQQIYPTC